MAGFDAIARVVVRRRGRVALCWLLVAATLLPAAARLDETLAVSARVDGSESAAVEDALARRFGSPFARHAILVVTGVPSPATRGGRAVLELITTRLDETQAVARTFSYLDTPDSLFVGRGGLGTFVVVGLEPGKNPPDALVAPLRAASAALTVPLRARYPEIALRWTGEIALNFDLRRASAADANAAERRVLPLTLLLLVIAFGAITAAFAPILAGVLAIALALGAATMVSSHWSLSVLLQNVVSMLGLGLGIDYALLMVSRFRESLASGRTREEAAEDAAVHSGHTVVVSGAAVAIGFAALLFVPLNEMRSIAVGGLLVVAFSVLVATTLLPGLLAMAGHRIDAIPLPRFLRRSTRGDGWRKWGRFVAARPLLVLVAGATPVLLLAAQARRLSSDLPRGDWLPREMESSRALRDLQTMGRSGVVHSLRIILELPAGMPALEPGGWAAASRLTRWLAADPRVASVRSLPAIAPGALPGPLMRTLIPEHVRRSFIPADERATALEVLPREDANPNDLMQLVRELRAADAAALTATPGARLAVGGLPAFNVDYRDAIADRFPTLVGLVIVGTLLALFLAFRSVLVPIKAVALNLLSVVAAFGAMVLVFGDGIGARWLGLSGPMEGVFPAIPVLVFCIVFGLSMDYELFLVARVAEARRAGLSESDALGEALSRTGGVITSAAAIMIVVFAAFTLGDFLLIKMLGFALATAVLLDATIIRLAIGPALLTLAGKWNWWPGERMGAGRLPVLPTPAILSPSHDQPAHLSIPRLASRRRSTDAY